jgi:hypothetical protein
MYYNFIRTHKTAADDACDGGWCHVAALEIGDIVDVLEPWQAVQVDHGEAV